MILFTGGHAGELGGMRGCWGHAWLPGGAGLLGGVCVDARGA